MPETPEGVFLLLVDVLGLNAGIITISGIFISITLILLFRFAELNPLSRYFWPICFHLDCRSILFCGRRLIVVSPAAAGCHRTRRFPPQSRAVRQALGVARSSRWPTPRRGGHLARLLAGE